MGTMGEADAMSGEKRASRRFGGWDDAAGGGAGGGTGERPAGTALATAGDWRRARISLKDREPSGLVEGPVDTGGGGGGEATWG